MDGYKSSNCIGRRGLYSVYLRLIMTVLRKLPLCFCVYWVCEDWILLRFGNTLCWWYRCRALWWCKKLWRILWMHNIPYSPLLIVQYVGENSLIAFCDPTLLIRASNNTCTYSIKGRGFQEIVALESYLVGGDVLCMTWNICSLGYDSNQDPG